MAAIIITIALHSVVVLLAFFLFLIFAWWWWYESKAATSIYKYTCYLMFGITFTHGGAVWLYIEKLNHNDLDLDQIVPFWWGMRIVAMVIPLGLYMIHIVKKIYRENKRNHQQRGADRRVAKRREEDRRLEEMNE